MLKATSTRRTPRPSEEGYVLVAVICMLALLTLSLSVALPRIAKEIQRDRELETMQRGKQYMRAVKMYYKKFGAFPANTDALLKPLGVSNMRFLRKKYVDPTTGKEEWKPIHYGQQKTQSTGFFGQPVMGAGIVGVSGLPIPPAAGAGIGGSIIGTGNDPNAPAGSATNPANPSDPSTGSSDSAFGGQTFGGGGIVGYSPNSPKQSILVYRKKNHYNEWEFVYDPLADMMGGMPSPPPSAGGSGITPGTGGLQGGGGAGAGAGAGGAGGGAGAGGAGGSAGSGSGAGTGDSNTPPPPPTTP